MGAEVPLTMSEQLTFELYALDAEWMNGGLSQYFCNQGMEHWEALLRLASGTLPSFPPFAESVDRVVRHAPDPYLSVLEVGPTLDALYGGSRAALISELRARLSQ